MKLLFKQTINPTAIEDALNNFFKITMKEKKKKMIDRLLSTTENSKFQKYMTTSWVYFLEFFKMNFHKKFNIHIMDKLKN